MRQGLLSGGDNTNNRIMYRDWRTALSSPPTYRIGNRSFRFNYYAVFLILAILSLIFMFMYVKHDSSSSSDSWSQRLRPVLIEDSYNATYPLSTPILIRGSPTYRIAIVADLDTNSKVKDKDEWRSYMKNGFLSYNSQKKSVVITWEETEPSELVSSYSLKGRGMELSELVTFNGKLFTVDDRTGLIYEIVKGKVIPWVILPDGDGSIAKGFKAEWATVKDRLLYVGSMGKEWTSSQGDFENENPMWVKTVSANGEVKHLDWSVYYKLMREHIGITWPGYMIHESGMFSNKNRKWYFLPRRCSREKYNETRDEHMGCNVLICADEHFTDIKITKIDKIKPTHGYSSFKFIPGTDDQIIVALKTEEVNGKTATFISVFDVNGGIILEEEKVPTDLKYEGFEFI
ncbi:soluble calcium-activated nucleotidase 1 [Condylostylus longicornis]|uniref:soluble calcium-activated nucleotidase 1 n=1 Tax=Condylostylus longicornis TaxID=2530218 RepID=UPI00244DB519|nr:soluble calcium-activated nucleotidase 1 [Condylostylus longicornis]